jgi:ribosomal 30S subunit maturation factor RimM
VNKPETVVVGRVGKSHGLDGAFVVEGASESPELFGVGSMLLV